jgi:hypothetical protein
MNHPEEGVLLAARDGEPVGASARAHIDACAACRGTVASARRRAAAIDALLAEPAPPLDVEGAKRRVRARLDAEREQGRRHATRFRHARRAAAVLLVSAGAAYALPGSPVPVWLGLEEPATAGHGDPESVPASPPRDDEQEILLVPAGDGIDIIVEAVPAGADVEVVWLPGSSARISAGTGARYAIADGRAIATAGEGPVRIGIPRSAPRISITINGRTVYEGTSEEGDARDVARRSADGIVFLASDP